jgi:hypothetical protein
MTDFTHPLTAKRKEYLTTLFNRAVTAQYSMNDNSYRDELKDMGVMWQRGLNPNQHNGHNDVVPSCLADVLKLPEYEPDRTISALIRATREVEGSPTTYIVRVWMPGPPADSGGDFILESRVEPLRYMPQTALRAEDVPVIEKGDANLSSAYTDLRALINDYIYFTDEIEYDLVALGACSSYFREVFSAYPYFDINSATYGSGKTTVMKSMIWASYHGAVFIIPTEAAIFRVIEDTKGALGIDQIDNLYVNFKQNANLVNLLDAGYQRGAEVVRIDMDSGVAKSYDAFGLKVFTRKGPLPNSLISRTISITMTENKGFKQLKHDPSPETFSAVRAQLMSYRLRHTGTVKATCEALQNTELGIDGRTRELYLPLLTVAKIIDAGLFLRVLDHAKAEGDRKDQLKHDPIVVYLVELLCENVGDYAPECKVITIRDALNAKLRELGELGDKKGYGSKTVISMLELLGFERSRKRSQGNIGYYISATRVDILRQVYLRNGENGELLPPPNSPNSPNSLIPPSATPENEPGTLIQPTTATPSATPQDFGEVSEVSEFARDEWGEAQKTVVDGVEYPLIKYSNGGLCRMLLLECPAGHRAVYKVSLGSKIELIACAYGQHAGGLKVVRDLSAEINGGSKHE